MDNNFDWNLFIIIVCSETFSSNNFEEFISNFNDLGHEHRDQILNQILLVEGTIQFKNANSLKKFEKYSYIKKEVYCE